MLHLGDEGVLGPVKRFVPAELIADWASTQAWGPPAGVPIEVVGSYRFVEALAPRDHLEHEQAAVVAREYIRLDRVDRLEVSASAGDSTLTESEYRAAGGSAGKWLRMDVAELQESVETMVAGEEPELDDPQRWALVAAGLVHTVTIRRSE
ncbi:hypothetical protein BH18ACT1_BH18ACT1_12580 [soil metagenome]